MALITVDVADLAVSTSAEDVIVTYALGSCIAIVVYDPILRVGGMIHYMLPLSSTNPERAEREPATFADTGVPILFRRMYAEGCQKGSLVVKLVGGGNMHDDKGTFEIGKKNHAIARKMLWKNGILVQAEDVGGQKSRTVRLWIANGRVTVRSHEGEQELV